MERTTTNVAGRQLAYVSLDEIEVGESNKMFRDDLAFQPDSLKELADSIKDKGVIQPVLLRPGKKKKYELVCGERRFRASLLVCKDKPDAGMIPANIRPLSDEEALECQITENLQRNDVNPMREARAFHWMMFKKKYTTQQIATKIGKSMDYVQERCRLNDLGKRAQDLVATGVLPLKAALKIVRIPASIQEQALAGCVYQMEGASGKQTVFSGMPSLQNWLNSHAFNDLARADFDKENVKLNPAAGACSTCTKRTKNAGGLFDEFTKEDHCFDGECFIAKTVANYKQRAAELQKKFPDAKIVYKSRNYRVHEVLQKKLSPIIGNYEYARVLTPEQVKNNKDAKLAVAARRGPVGPKSYIFRFAADLS